jgi:uncharacterized protein (TIGR02217 family)
MTLPVFPTLAGVSWPVKRTPMWSTIAETSVSGRNSRSRRWSYPRYQIELPYEFLRADVGELDSLMGFFNQVGGSADLWQFTDPDDGTATDAPFGTGDGTTVAFQLARTKGGFSEPVFAPTGTVAIKAAGTPVSGSGFTVGTTGLITFNAAPANGAALTWSGAFNWLCRFNTDTTTFEKFMKNLWDNQSIVFTTEKLGA